MAHTPDVAAVLEVEAGTGVLWTYNYDRLPMAWWVWLTDDVPATVSQLRNAVDGAPQVTVTEGVLDHLPVGASAFDTVVANHVLEHHPHPDRVLAEIQRVLRPGGVLIAAADGPDHLIELDRLLTGRADGYEPLEPERFSLHNGAERLSEHFADVRLERFTDEHRLADADAVLALVRSAGCRGLTAKDIEAIRAEVTATIDRDGQFPVTMDTGLFVATTPEADAPEPEPRNQNP